MSAEAGWDDFFTVASGIEARMTGTAGLTRLLCLSISLSWLARPSSELGAFRVIGLLGWQLASARPSIASDKAQAATLAQSGFTLPDAVG